MAGPNKGTAVSRRAKAKGYDVYPRQHKGTDMEEKEERSHDWAAKSRMFYDENKNRESSKGAKSNTNKIDKRRTSIGSLPSKRAANVKVGTVK